MKKILVVDDEIQLRELLRKVLTAEGYDVVTAPLAAQALDRIFRESFDLVILDMSLTDGSGMSVLKRIRSADSRIPVVIYSGLITPEIEKEARLLGANDVLQKNIGMAPLAAQIGKILKMEKCGSAQPFMRADAKILFVDDDEGVRRFLKKFFTDKGYSALEAGDGEAALKIISSEPVSVVLLDLEMPVMNGLATLKKILEIKPGLGVVMATGEHDYARIKEALDLGAYSYVLKPFDFLYLDLVVTSKLAIAE